MATLDFSELDKNPPGESFEALVRLIGERLGLVPQWSGRGSDGGRDLFFIETQEGSLSARPVKWLVCCKDNSSSKSSVYERDIGSVTDKIAQHGCQGFLLATTTTASAGLKAKLDSLDVAHGGKIQTKVWDRFDITNLLRDERCTDLLLQFFPTQDTTHGKLTVDSAREMIENAVPRFVAGELRKLLVPHDDRLEAISGQYVWPHDSDQSEIIDDIKSDIALGRKPKLISEKLTRLHFDAFAALIDRLSRNFPHETKLVLKQLAHISTDPAVLFNVIEFLREDGNFGLDEELEIAKNLDPETLHELYEELTKDMLGEIGAWDWRLPREVLNYDDRVELTNVCLKELEFSGGDAVSFSGCVTLTVFGSNFDPDVRPAGEADFTIQFSGYWLYDGIELEEMA